MAYTGGSIVDYLKSIGKDSSVTSRIALGKEQGIDFSKTTTNYGDENTQLLTSLRGSATPTAPEVPETPDPISKTPEIPSQTSTPDLPETNAQTTIENYTNDYATTLESTRSTLEAKYKSELERINTEKEAAQTKIDEFTSKTEDVLTDDVKPLLDPFRADLETSERERLKVEDNYFENQALTEELGGLLTQIQNDVNATKDITGLASIREPRISKAVEDATARVGVIEAVMAARNNQISQAYTLIDRSVTAITADRQDQLTYYNSILSFYDSQKDEEGNKLIDLNKEEQGIIDSKIGLLESDMVQAQANADYIKNLMTNPDTASFMAKAGITLNDNPAEVQKKMAEQSNRDQVTDFTNGMKADGYEFVAYKGDRTDLVSFDVGGQTLWFKAPVEDSSSSDKVDMTDYLANQGVPLTVSTDSGDLTKTMRQNLLEEYYKDDDGNKVYVFTLDTIDGLWENMRAGNSFAEIREGIILQGGDPKILDTFVRTLQGY